MVKTRFRTIVSGGVQGVFYRAFCVDTAQAFNVSGYAKNLSDGTVEIVVEGEREECKGFLGALKVRDGSIDVQGMKTSEEEYTGRFNGFGIAY